MTISWKYTNTGKSSCKHMFIKDKNSAVCGYSIPWYKPEQWQTDKEGLDSRRECMRCTHIYNHPQDPTDWSQRNLNQPTATSLRRLERPSEP